MKKFLGLFLALVVLFGGAIVVNAEDTGFDFNDNNGATQVGDTNNNNLDLSGCDETCDAISEVSTEKNPKTGSFVPYAIVIGGIVFSISAIALAKKNNKLYQV